MDSADQLQWLQQLLPLSTWERLRPHQQWEAMEAQPTLTINNTSMVRPFTTTVTRRQQLNIVSWHLDLWCPEQAQPLEELAGAEVIITVVLAMESKLVGVLHTYPKCSSSRIKHCHLAGFES